MEHADNGKAFDNDRCEWRLQELEALRVIPKSSHLGLGYCECVCVNVCE